MTSHTPPQMQDWGRLISFRPERVLRPGSIEELQEVLEQVHRGEIGEGRVRVPGSLHSCAKIAVAETLIDVAGLPKKIELVDEDTAVEATANVTLHEFLAELGRHGKSVTATGGTDHQTLAGLISTGTAPASSRHALYELLEWVELVRVEEGSGRAELRRIERSEPEFAAVVCSLGALGVIVRVRFGLVDEPHFRVVQKVVDLDEVLADLDATAAKYDFWRVNWMQKSDKALLWAATEVPPGEAEPDGDYPADRSEQVLDFVFGALDTIGETGPLLNKPLELIYEGLALTYDDSEASGPLRNMLPVDRRAPLRVAMAEWSFRPADTQRVVGECRQYFEEHGWPNIPTEIELTRCDTALMSPWNWNDLDHVVKFNFMYLTEVCTEPGEKEEIYAHLRGLWNHLGDAGIPFKAHWGKINFIDPEFAAANHRLGEFMEQVSPMFLNEYLEERLGSGEPAPAPAPAPTPPAFPGLTDIHAHPAMNAFLWDRNLERHYWTGGAFDPLASLTDFKMLRKGDVRVLWSALHVPEHNYFECLLIRLAAHLFRGGRKLLKRDYWDCLQAQLAMMEEQVAASDDFEVARSGAELDWVLAAGKRAIIHTVEGGHVLGAGLADDDLDTRLARLDWLADRGIAMLTIAHLFPNELAGHAEGIPEDQHSLLCPLDSGVDLDRGLSTTGRAVVEHMVERRILPDVTHCSPRARHDVYDLVGDRIPVLASHIGVHSLNPVPYNLERTDVEAIAASGGVVGVIFMPYWLESSHPDDGLESIWKTMEQVAEWSSWEHVAVGTDFDGFTDPADDCDSEAKLPRVRELLEEKGLARAQVEAVLGGNARRVLRDGWR